MYKVKQEDLIGDIKDFPIEVVQRMIECQIEQGNEANVASFQRRKKSNRYFGGFNWDETIEGSDFWRNIVEFGHFILFFWKYPKNKLNKNSDSSINMKYDSEKLRWDLLPLEDIEDIVKVYTEGAKKYTPNSWQNLPDGYDRYKAAMFRHLLEYEKGNTVDEETGCKHLAQVVWNAIAMLHVSKINNKS